MAARPRLLLLTPDYPPSPGGIQVVSERLASGMGGFETLVLALGEPGGGTFDRARTQAVHRVGAAALPHAARLGLLNAVALTQALRFRPQLTLSMHIITSPAAAAIRRFSGARAAQYFHAEEIGARRGLARFAAENADAAIAVSRYTAGLVADVAPATSAIVVIPNGVELPADAAPEHVDRPTFLTVARIQERYKGHDVLVRALALIRAKVPDVHWVVLGDGSLRAGIEQLADSYGVADAVSFLGAVPDEERNSWLRRSDLFAMASRLPAAGFAGEGFGIAFLEAGAYGKPVVAGNVAGALDAVIDGETGLLVDPNDATAVAEAITRLLLDRELAARLGAGGRARAEELSWPAICARVEAVLMGLLAGVDVHAGATTALRRNGHEGPLRQPHR